MSQITTNIKSVLGVSDEVAAWLESQIDDRDSLLRERDLPAHVVRNAVATGLRKLADNIVVGAEFNAGKPHGIEAKLKEQGHELVPPEVQR